MYLETRKCRRIKPPKKIKLNPMPLLTTNNVVDNTSDENGFSNYGYQTNLLHFNYGKPHQLWWGFLLC